MPNLDTYSSTDERPGSNAMESNPVKTMNDRTAARMNETTWFSVSEEAKRPMAEYTAASRIRPMNEPAIPPLSRLPGVSPSTHTDMTNTMQGSNEISTRITEARNLPYIIAPSPRGRE